MDTNAPIGVFDSGVGGLTVAREIMRQIPNERIVYFGDTARVPYGSKSKDIITKYSRQIIRFLLTENVKAIVIACNTASAFALDTMQKEFDIPIIGVLKPGAKVAAKTTVNGRIGLIGTEGTIHSGMYAQFIKSIKPDVEVIGKPCPLFVPLVEEGMLHDTITDQVAERYLSTLKDKNIDTLIIRHMRRQLNLKSCWRIRIWLMYAMWTVHLLCTVFMSVMQQRSLRHLPIPYCHLT